MDNSQLLTFIAAALADGLPAFKSITMYGSQDQHAIYLDFDDPASADAWVERFSTSDDRPVRHEQPYPIDAPYEIWTTQQWFSWNGWAVHTSASVPITDEQRRQWIDSGQAAARAEFVARKTATEQGS